MKNVFTKNLVVCDIDDCLIQTTSESIAIIRKSDGKRLSTDEFAKDPEAKDESKFSFEEFRNPKCVYESIIKSKPLVKNLSIMDKYINKGYKFSILTGRGLDPVVKKAVSKFIMYRDRRGNLRPIGNKFMMRHSACVNDPKYEKLGNNVAERKATFLRQICKKYKNVTYIDDDTKNITAALKLHIPNLTIIQV